MSAIANLPVESRSGPSAVAASVDRALSWLLRPSVLIRVVLYSTFALYARTITFDYVYDDNALLIVNPWISSWKYVPTIFTHSFWAFLEVPRATDFYRPMVMFLFSTIYQLLGPIPGWFHLVTICLHLLASYLVYKLAIEAVGEETTAVLAAAIFGLHPTKVETAAWISGVSDSLSAVFFLGSMILYLRSRRSTAQFQTTVLSLILLVFALLSKEAAALCPVLVAIYAFASADGTWRRRTLEAFRSALPFAAITGIVLTIRLLLVRIPTGRLLDSISLRSTFLAAPKVVWWYIGKQLWAAHLSVQYPRIIVDEVSITGFILPLISLLMLGTIVALAVRRSAAGILFASWFAVTLAPIVLYHGILEVHDRYFYLSSVATSIGIAWLLTSVRDFNRKLHASLVVIVLVICGAATAAYSGYWDNDVKLFSHVIEEYPNDPGSYDYLAQLYIERGQPEKAEALARKLLQNPNGQGMGWYIVGKVRSSAKDYEQAREAFRQCLVVWNQHNLLPSLALANADLHLNRNEEALQLYQNEAKKYPEMAFLHGQMADVLQKMGRPQESTRELELQQRYVAAR